MILSASRRTDIPCFYAEWLMNRLRAGFVLTRNPMNPRQLFRVPLSPQTTDCIVFWTKDAQHMLPYLDELDAMDCRYYFQFTLTPYDNRIERNLRAKSEIESTFRQLSTRLGRERVVWRYDPILLSGDITVDYHQKQFLRMCEKLAPYTDTVTVSFVDWYAKLRNAGIRPPEEGEMAELAGFIGETAAACGLSVTACCERDLSPYGIQKGSCIDRGRIEKIIGAPLDIRADRNQRAGCGCCESIDIGMYDSCANGCLYCYATKQHAAAQKRAAAHDPQSELLLGSIAAGETVIEKAVQSDKSPQLTLF